MDVELDDDVGAVSNRRPLASGVWARPRDLEQVARLLEEAVELVEDARQGRHASAARRLGALSQAAEAWVTTATDTAQAVQPLPQLGPRVRVERTVGGDTLVGLVVDASDAEAAERLLTTLATLASGGAPAPLPHDDAAAIDAWAAGLGVSRRLQDVARLRARGHTEREIGAHLGVTWRTARTYVERLYRTLGVRSHAELVRRALAARSPSRALPSPLPPVLGADAGEHVGAARPRADAG